MLDMITGKSKDAASHNLTPREIVAQLDRYIVGQDDAKRAVAIAIRNRWRRQQLSDEMRREIAPVVQMLHRRLIRA